MQILRQSTAVDVLIGPFVDSTNGYTAEEALSPTVLVSKTGQGLAGKSDATTPTHDDAGYYNCELDTTDTGTLGTLVLVVEGNATSLPVRHEYMVMEANAWDAMYAASGTGYIDANTTLISGDSTAADNAESFFDGTGYAGTNNVIPSVTTVTGNVDGSVASVTGAVGSVTGAVGSVTGAVGSVTGNVGGNVTGSVGSLVGHTVQTGDSFARIGAAGASLTDLGGMSTAMKAEVNAEADTAISDAALATAANLATVDTVVDGIKAVTDVLPDSGALTSLATASALATVDTEVGAIQTDLSNGTDGLGALKTLIDNLNDPTAAAIATAVLTTAVTESYNTDGAAPTLTQAVMLILQILSESSVAGTTLTVKKLDGSTSAATFTLDDGTTPTSITRAS